MSLWISIHAPAKGATYRTNLFWTYKLISIHAPAKGATETWDLPDYPCLISIHAPAKGATGVHPPLNAFHMYFNPRSREGSDKIDKKYAKGDFNFNPRSREGSD